MTDRGGRQQWAGEIPVETLEKLREEASTRDIPQWRLVTEAVDTVLGVDMSTEAGFRRRIEELEEQERLLSEEIAEKETRLERLSSKRENLESQLEEFLENQESYKDRLDGILRELVENSGTNIRAYQGELREAAKHQYGRFTQDNIEKVKDDLRKRRDETGVEVADTRLADMPPESTSANVAADGHGEDVPESFKKLESGELEINGGVE